MRTHGVAIAVLSFVLGCGETGGTGPGPGEGAGGKADGVGGSAACEVTDLRSGAPGGGFDPGELGDAIAAKVLADGQTCPRTYSETIAKLRQTDAAGCAGERDGLSTALVTEDSQLQGTPGFIRSVTSRACDGREPFEMLFSLLGLDPDADALPDNVEVIAFDRTAGVFNYYTLEEGGWGFHGTSKDFVVPDSEARCAACHTGGGLIMKELPNPWVHWEGAAATPRSGELVDAFPDLGEHADGAFMELDVVDPGNERWLRTRVPHVLAQGSVETLLRPLFCAVEVNVDTVSDPLGFVVTFTVPGDALADPFFTPPGVPSDEGLYQELIQQTGQRIEVDDDDPLLLPDGMTARDTAITMAFPMRARADSLYVEALVDANVISSEFAADVLAIDLTRPVFSKARCDLVKLAPDLGRLVDDEGAPRAGLAEAIRDGFAARLRDEAGAAGPAGAELLAHLEEDGDEAAHQARAEAFTAACRGRPKRDFMADFLAVISLRREQARQRSVFEFRASLPVDDLLETLDPDTHFDPQTCELVPPRAD